MVRNNKILEKDIGFIDAENKKIVYPFLDKEYPDKPEEQIRLLMLKKLILEYKYSPKQIDIEIPVKAGQTTLPKRADIIVFRDERSNRPEANSYIIVEVKKKDRKDGIDQLQTYINNTTAEFGIWFNGKEIVYLHRLRKPHKFDEIPDIPKKGETLEDVGLFYKKDLVPATELKSIFETIHNHIYANEGLLKDKVFNEMLKIIFIKMVDEKSSSSKCEFRITAKERELVEEGKGKEFVQRIVDLFERVKTEYKDVFDRNERINLRPTTLAFVVSQLQKYNLRETPADVKGTAFQTFVYAHQRGDRGEFFTPHPILKLMVEMMNPTDGEMLLDPACGSGGFLVEAMRYVWNKFKETNPNVPAVDLIKYAHNYIRGIDFNPDLAKVAKMHMVLYDDGHTGIFSANSLEDFDTLKKIATESLVSDIEPEAFNIILTNPPFGSKGKVTSKRILEQFDLGYKWVKDKNTGKWKKTKTLQNGQVPDILFIERCLQFLKDYGRLAIVLPDGDLTNQNTEYVRQFIMSKARILAVVSLPQETFVPHGAGVKASVLFVQKLPQEELKKLEKKDYPIFFAVIEKIGYDIRGRTVFKKDEKGEPIKDEKCNFVIDTDIPEIIESFREFRRKYKIKFYSWEEL